MASSAQPRATRSPRKSAWWGVATAIALLIGTGVGPQPAAAGDRSSAGRQTVQEQTVQGKEADARDKKARKKAAAREEADRKKPAQEEADPEKADPEKAAREEADREKAAREKKEAAGAKASSSEGEHGKRPDRRVKPDGQALGCALARIDCCIPLAREVCCPGLARIGCDPPVLTVAFADEEIDDHGTTTLSIDLDRIDATEPATDLGYVVALPAGLTIAESAQHNVTCSGTVSTTTGDTSVTLSGATISADITKCKLQVLVTAAASGTYAITTGDISGLAGGVTNGVTTETLTVEPALPRLSGSFTPSTVDVLGTSMLRLSLRRTDDNPDAVAAGLGYSISLPAGLVVGTGGVDSDDCGGTATAAPGGTSIVLSAGELAAADKYCEVLVSVKATTGGEHAIDYSDVTSVSGVEKALNEGCLTSVDEVDAKNGGCLPTLTAEKLAQTVTFTQPADRSITAGPVALTASASSELTVAFTADTPLICTVSGSTLTPAGVGTCSVTAVQAGNGTYEAAPAVTRTLAITGVVLLPQSITFGQPSPVALSEGTTTLSASASSGLTVTFTSSTPLVCTVSGSTLTLVSSGTCTIEAAQPGNDAYAAAAPVTRAIDVTKKAQTISFASLGAVPLAEGSVAATVTASSGLAVTLTSSTPNVCTVAGQTITLVAGGTCTVDADQGGDNEYAAADTVSRSFTVAVPPAAPQQVSATPGVSSINVTWTAPSDPSGITGYTAVASPGPATCTTTGATACVMGGTAGVTYTITVVAASAIGNSDPSGPSNPVTPTAPEPPAQVPVTDLNLTTDQGLITTAEPGQLIVFIGTGFAPYSTVTISIYSEPIVLGTVVTDGAGDFRKPITVPPDLAEGAHTAVAQGVAPDGTTRAMNLAITVAAAAPSAPAEPGDQLPVTGINVATILLAGMISLVTGAGLVLGARTRSRRPVPAGRLTA